jgi:hypothetical protein
VPKGLGAAIFPPTGAPKLNGFAPPSRGFATVAPPKLNGFEEAGAPNRFDAAGFAGSAAFAATGAPKLSGFAAPSRGFAAVAPPKLNGFAAAAGVAVPKLNGAVGAGFGASVTSSSSSLSAPDAKPSSSMITAGGPLLMNEFTTGALAAGAAAGAPNGFEAAGAEAPNGFDAAGFAGSAAFAATGAPKLSGFAAAAVALFFAKELAPTSDEDCSAVLTGATLPELPEAATGNGASDGFGGREPGGAANPSVGRGFSTAVVGCATSSCRVRFSDKRNGVPVLTRGLHCGVVFTGVEKVRLGSAGMLRG